MATEYSDDSECSSESGDEIEAVLKAVPKIEACPVKTKRSYTRKTPLNDAQKSAIVDKLAKARAARVVSQTAKKLSKAQEQAEIAELHKLKKEGKLKIKKEKPTPVEIPKQKKVKEQVKTEIHNHYYGAAEDDDAPVPKPAKVKKTILPQEPATPRVVARPAAPKKMIFA